MNTGRRATLALVLGVGLMGCGAYGKAMKQGDEYMLSGRYAAAARTYTKALDKKPRDPAALVAVAEAWLQEGEPGQALPPAELAAHAQAPGGQAVLAAALIGTGQHERAVEVAREAVATEPDDPRSHLLLAESLLSTGDLDGAVGAAETAMPLKPGGDGLAFAAWVHSRAGNHDRARSIALRLTGPEQEDPAVLAEAAAVHRAAGHAESAQDAAGLARAFMRGHDERWRADVARLGAAGDLEGAIRRMSWLRAVYPEDGQLALELGELWVMAEASGRALAELGHARKLTPLVDIEASASKKVMVDSVALRDLSAEEQSALMERLFLAMAAAHKLQDDTAATVSAREQALTWAGSGATGEQWLELSRDLHALGALDRSLAAGELALERLKDPLPAHLQLLRVQAARGQVDQAIAQGRRALALSPGDPVVVAPLAELYLHRGDRREALDLLERTLTVHPDHEALQALHTRARGGR